MSGATLSAAGAAAGGGADRPRPWRRAAPGGRWPEAAGAPAAQVARGTAARIQEVSHAFEEFHYRAPYMFGGRKVDRTTLCNVHLPAAHRRRAGGRGLRIDDPGQRLGLPRRLARGGPGGDARPGRAAGPHHRRLHGERAPDGPVPRAGAGVPARRRRAVARAAAAHRHPQAGHPGGGQRLRRGPARRLRQGLRAERLPDLRRRTS